MSLQTAPDKWNTTITQSILTLKLLTIQSCTVQKFVHTQFYYMYMFFKKNADWVANHTPSVPEIRF